MLFTERNFLLEFIKKKTIKIRLKINSPCTFLQVTETSMFAPQDLLFRNKYDYNTSNQQQLLYLMPRRIVFRRICQLELELLH